MNLSVSDSGSPETKNWNICKTPAQKKIKPSQSNTLNNWLTKDVSHGQFKSGNTETLKCKKVHKHSTSQPSENKNISSKDSTEPAEQSQIKQGTSSLINDPTPKKKKKKKHRQENLKEKSSNNIRDDTQKSKKKSNFKSKNKNTSDVLEDTNMNDDDLTRDKFKRIITSPLSPKNLEIKNRNSQSNTISKWLCKYDSSSSVSDVSDITNSAKKKCKENIDKLKLELVPDGNKKRKKCLDNCNTGMTSDVEHAKIKTKKKSKSDESSKCPKEVEVPCGKFDSSLPINDVLKQTEKENKSSKNLTTVASNSRKLFDVDLFSPSGMSNAWLSKEDMSSFKSSKTKKKGEARIDKKSTKYKKLDVKINSNKPNPVDGNKNKSKKKTTGHTLDFYLSKYTKERKFSRNDSNESYECPFIKKNKKLKTIRTSDSFKKYGVNLPSVEEIIKDQKDFTEYKNQIDSFKDIDDKFLELPFSVKNLKPSPEINSNVLGCKHLSLDDVEKAFNNNLDYTSAIFRGERYSERHERFFEEHTRNYTFTLKDLCYNTSTIVFSFEQMEHLIALLKREFDPDDKWTSYFFQVLLPELCLKIFMDTHSMTYDEAVKYLDNRPVVD